MLQVVLFAVVPSVRVGADPDPPLPGFKESILDKTVEASRASAWWSWAAG